MDQPGGLGELPEIYAVALRLRDAGLDDAAIAARLEMPPEGVGPLLSVAAAKLAALAEREPTGGESGGGS